MNRKKINDFKFFKRTVLKAIHAAQKFALNKNMMKLYYGLFKLHFKIWFEKDLIEEIVNGSEEGDMAARRYARMIVYNYSKNVSSIDSTLLKKRYKLLESSFKKNIMLEYKLEE